MFKAECCSGLDNSQHLLNADTPCLKQQLKQKGFNYVISLFQSPKPLRAQTDNATRRKEKPKPRTRN